MTAAVPAPEDAPRQPVGDGTPAAGAGEPPPADPSAVGSWERVRWFGMLWVLASIAHFSDSRPLEVLSVLAFGLPLLAYPTSALAFGLFVAGAGVSGLLELPMAANHTVVSLCVALGFGVAALYLALTRNRAGGDGPFLPRWVELARTPVTLTLLVVYFFTVFHKLNTAFFDPAVSCAGTLLGNVFSKNGLAVAVPPGMVQASAVGTVLVEAAILVLLAVPRTRRWGLLLGIGFHLVLAPGSFWDFSTMVFALYLLFVPTRVFAGLAGRSNRTRTIALVAFGVHLLVSILVSLTGTTTGPFGLRWHTVILVAWYVAVVPLLVQLVRACFADRDRWPGYRLRPVVLLLVPLLAFVNGAAPYLGLKTVASYSMFSNLHTEQGVANHLVPGLTALQLLPYQRDTVTLTDVHLRTDRNTGAVFEPHWAREKPPTTIPWLELRLVVAQWREERVANIHLEYRRGAETKVVENALTDPELSQPPSWWQRRLLAFRAITSGDGPDKCRW